MTPNSNRQQNIELGADEPPMEKIMAELETAMNDANWFYRRMEQARHWWQSRWHGQTIDGRKHEEAYEEEVFPWEGSADHRVRSVATLIRNEVSVCKFAFFKSNVQAKAMRPLVQGRQANQATRLLRWRIYNHMWAELIREVPFLLNWWRGYGVALMGVQWEQSRRLEHQPITVPDLAEILGLDGSFSSNGQDPLLHLQSMLTDPSQEDALTTLVQGLSPIVTRPQARKIVQELRQVRYSTIPLSFPFLNKPRWRALRPTIDCLFPSEASDLQQERFYNEMEWVSETELTDRIETEGYDAAFVEKAKQHKGEAGLDMMPEGPLRNPRNSYRDLIQLYHFRYRVTMEGTPIMLKTVFSPVVTGKRGTKDAHLYAKHGPDEYDHGLYPAVVFRRTFQDRRILHSVGIAEEAYTYEQALKAQLDGLTDRTSMINKPAMIVPQNKVDLYRNNLRPGAVLGSNRPKEVTYTPLPPSDGTPVEVIKMVTQLMHEMYPLFGADVDEQLKQLYRQEVGDDTTAGFSLVLDMTFQLMQQYEVDAEVAAVVGGLERPFHVDRSEIQGKHQITAVTDMRMLNDDYTASKLDNLGKIMPFKSASPLLFRMAVEAYDPDAADALDDDQMSPHAMELEKNDERNAITAAFAGMEWPFPEMGNWRLRLGVHQEVFGANPMMNQRLQMLPDTQKILKKRQQGMMNQIQQYEQNPQIGRALHTSALNPRTAPELMQGNTG